MKFLVAPDKLKGSLSATDAADCISAGILRAFPSAQIDQCPIADGGEGTVAAVLKSCRGRRITRRVTGPLPEMKVDAGFALLEDRTAVIEMSAASGLWLLPMDQRDPLATTTFGTGELVAAAIAEGASKIIVGLGGSATIDAGVGMAQACGFTVLMRDGQPTSMTEPLCGRDLPSVLVVKHGRGEITAGMPVIGATDVNCPLLGPTGAARVFGPQKGATPELAARLDTDLSELVDRTGTHLHAQTSGAGAAGGLGFGILAFFGGSLVNGFQWIADATQLSDRLIGVDLCVTAEGGLDAQTTAGKAVAGVARLCKNHAVPCIALAGSIGRGIESLHEQGLTAWFSICDGPMLLEESAREVRRLLTSAAEQSVRLWISGPTRN